MDYFPPIDDEVSKRTALECSGTPLTSRGRFNPLISWSQASSRRAGRPGC